MKPINIRITAMTDEASGIYGDLSPEIIVDDIRKHGLPDNLCIEVVRSEGTAAAIDRLQKENAERDKRIAELERELEEARKDAEKMKDILRTRPDRLELRMSFQDFHIMQFIPKHVLERAGSPAGVIEQHSRLMYKKLEVAQAARQQQG